MCFPLLNLWVFSVQLTVGFPLQPHGMIMPLFHRNTSGKSKNLPLSPQSVSLFPGFLICLIALMVDQKKISFCLRSHPSLSQSNYKPGYFQPSAKHIAAWYCMTSFSYLSWLEITLWKYTHTAVKVSGELLKDFASEVKSFRKPHFEWTLKLRALKGSLCRQQEKNQTLLIIVMLGRFKHI